MNLGAPMTMAECGFLAAICWAAFASSATSVPDSAPMTSIPVPCAAALAEARPEEPMGMFWYSTPMDLMFSAWACDTILAICWSSPARMWNRRGWPGSRSTAAPGTALMTTTSV